MISSRRRRDPLWENQKFLLKELIGETVFDILNEMESNTLVVLRKGTKEIVLNVQCCGHLTQVLISPDENTIGVVAIDANCNFQAQIWDIQ